MAITDDNMVLPVQPLYNGGNYGNNGGLFGGGDSWLGILFLIALLNGGWGGFGGFGGGYGAMMGMGMMDGGFGLYPWLNNSQNINDGFRTQALGTQVGDIQNSITAGFGDVQTALCGGFASVNQNVSNGTAAIQNSLCNGFNGVNTSINAAQNALTQQLNSNEIASLNRSFAEQTANMQGFNGVNAGVADLRYTVATEACADRANSTQNTQSILNLVNSGIQSIKDQLCQDKIDAKNDEIAQLRQEILYTRGQAAAESIYQRGQNSQDVQTAQILAGQAAIPGQVYTRLSECPVSTVPVYGRQPIFTCPQTVGNYGCGCGAA